MIQFQLKDLQSATGGEWYNPVDQELIITGIKTDTREKCGNALFLALAGEKFDAHDFLENAVNSDASALCINRSAVNKINSAWKLPVLIVNDTVTAFQQIARFHKRRLKGLKTIGVTGSMGKTSVKEIIRSILAAAVGEDAVHATVANTNNQIGVPQNLLMLDSRHRYAVIEMGTNHHGEIEPLSRCAEPDVAVIASVGPCHLEFLGDLNGVATEKAKIFSGLHPSGVAIIPDKCPGVEILEKAAEKFKLVRFGKSAGSVRADYLGGKLHGSTIKLSVPDSTLSPVVNWKLSGAHQAFNAAAATAAAMCLGIEMDAVTAGLADCVLPGMRMKITEKNGITWINDAYNANPGSMPAAIEWLAEFAEPEKLVLVLGDMLELGEATEKEHQQVINFAVTTFPAANFFLVGPQMTAAVRKIKTSAKIITCTDSTEAAGKITPFLTPGVTVFLKGSRGMHLETVEPKL